jgi:hypothetical protein
MHTKLIINTKKQTENRQDPLQYEFLTFIKYVRKLHYTKKVRRTRNSHKKPSHEQSN